jgi:hypothetical protein
MISIREIRDDYSPEMALVILICRVYFKTASADELDEYITSNKIDHGLFKRIITVHQVRPLVYKVLSAAGHGIGQAFIDTLRKQCFQIAGQNLHKAEELVRINKLFKKRSVKVIPYKGVILSRHLFDDLISRETVDIDLLTEPESFSKVLNILVDDGYEPKYYNPDFEKQFLRTSHELQCSKDTPAGRIKIEIHWAATNIMMNIPLPNADILYHLRTMDLLGEDIEVLDLKDHLLVLFVHHGVNDIWRTLRHALDIAIFVEMYHSDIDWAEFHDATVKYNIRHTCEVGLLVCRELFGITIPAVFDRTAHVPPKILDNLLMFPALKKRKLDLENLKQQLFLRDSFKDRVFTLLSYIRTGVTPNVRDMEAYPIAKKWYFMYYFIKPFRILFNRS